MSSANASVFFCGGITTYAPLKLSNIDSKSAVDIMGFGMFMKNYFRCTYILHF
jgi:D-arabinose 1-dehydrogenase-like Zn-dependent alcohol dehydrogenase